MPTVSATSDVWIPAKQHSQPTALSGWFLTMMAPTIAKVSQALPRAIPSPSRIEPTSTTRADGERASKAQVVSRKPAVAIVSPFASLIRRAVDIRTLGDLIVLAMLGNVRLRRPRIVTTSLSRPGRMLDSGR
jgi:hypothetical protein